mmetsp:Transcript_24562/g.52901  ORF Transcript_24562/g.52901 Transcript_24562/m.52901 type:complete len:372 (+) Transcript_24562:1269-2384(+)
MKHINLYEPPNLHSLRERESRQEVIGELLARLVNEVQMAETRELLESHRNASAFQFEVLQVHALGRTNAVLLPGEDVDGNAPDILIRVHHLWRKCAAVVLQVLGSAAIIIQREALSVHNLVAVPHDAPAQAWHGLNVRTPVRGEDIAEASVASEKDPAQDIEQPLQPRKARHIHCHLLRADPDHRAIHCHPEIQRLQRRAQDPVHEAKDPSHQGQGVLVPSGRRQENHAVNVVIPFLLQSCGQVDQKGCPTQAVSHNTELVRTRQRIFLLPVLHLGSLGLLQLMNLLDRCPHIVHPQLVEGVHPELLHPWPAFPRRGTSEVCQEHVKAPVVRGKSNGTLISLEDPPVRGVHHAVLKHHDVLGLRPRNPVQI